MSFFKVFAANVKAISIDARVGTVSYAARNLSFGLLGFPRRRFSGWCLIQTLPKIRLLQMPCGSRAAREMACIDISMLMRA